MILWQIRSVGTGAIRAGSEFEWMWVPTFDKSINMNDVEGVAEQVTCAPAALIDAEWNGNGLET